MITVDIDKCNGCGQCVSICHESCMRMNDNKIHIDVTYRSTCG